MKREVAIIHFNTPELTEAAILSLRKHGGEDYHVTVLDNSCTVRFPAGMGLTERVIEARPFKKRMKGVKRVDNTKGQIVDFAKELAKYPDRNHDHAACNDWGSVKHILSVQALWDIIDKPFLLMESDVLLRKNVDFMFQDEEAVVGHIQDPQPGNRFGIGRLVPMLCYMNVPLLKKCGARYFDPERSWMLYPGEDDRRNWYDTGACLLEDVRSHKNGLRGKRIDIRPLILHKQSGSWNKHKVDDVDWLETHADLWR